MSIDLGRYASHRTEATPMRATSTATARHLADPRPEARDARGRLWDGDQVTEPNGSTTEIIRRKARDRGVPR